MLKVHTQFHFPSSFVQLLISTHTAILSPTYTLHSNTTIISPPHTLHSNKTILSPPYTLHSNTTILSPPQNSAFQSLFFVVILGSFQVELVVILINVIMVRPALISVFGFNQKYNLYKESLVLINPNRVTS